MARQPRGKNPAKSGNPLKPKHLSEQASAEWDRLIGELEASGIQITPAHRALLALAATIAADIKADYEEVKKEGAYRMTDKGVQAHPAVKRMDALRRDYLKTLSAIGLRPGLASEKQEGDTLADILNG